MAQVTLTIPDAHLNEVVQALSDAWGWTPQSGITRAVAARRQLGIYIREVVRGARQQTLEAQRVTINAAVDTDLGGVE